ncbi:hypothetical protein GOL98_28045, partial [Streptomyces sp. Z38]|nr:hypothetical protein [Streptomyces sp. Z38]
ARVHRFPHLRQDAAASLVVFLVAVPLCLGVAVASGARRVFRRGGRTGRGGGRTSGGGRRKGGASVPPGACGDASDGHDEDRPADHWPAL